MCLFLLFNGYCGKPTSFNGYCNCYCTDTVSMLTDTVPNPTNTLDSVTRATNLFIIPAWPPHPVLMQISIHLVRNLSIVLLLSRPGPRTPSQCCGGARLFVSLPPRPGRPNIETGAGGRETSNKLYLVPDRVGAKHVYLTASECICWVWHSIR